MLSYINLNIQGPAFENAWLTYIKLVLWQCYRPAYFCIYDGTYMIISYFGGMSCCNEYLKMLWLITFILSSLDPPGQNLLCTTYFHLIFLWSLISSCNMYFRVNMCSKSDTFFISKRKYLLCIDVEKSQDLRLRLVRCSRQLREKIWQNCQKQEW